MSPIRFPTILVAFLVVFLSCDNGLKNPDFPDTPSIRLDDIKFIEMRGAVDYDSLKFTISYRDGDRNLGLSSVDEDDFTFPFQDYDFFLEDGSGDTIPIQSEVINDMYFGITSVPQNGTLATSKTRLKTNYEYLPAYNPASCLNYMFRSQLLVREDLGIIDESFDIEDTLNINGISFIRIEEVLLYRINKNHYNIFVEFFTFQDGNFEPFDFLKEYCMTYDGRFPLIAEKERGKYTSGPFTLLVRTPWEGKITYSMANTNWLGIFGNKPMRLKITIQDRSLKTSNTIITQDFVLENIK